MKELMRRCGLRCDAALAFLIVAAVLNGCAGTTLQSVSVSPDAVAAEEEKQREMAFRVAFERTNRLLNVSYPLMVAAADLAPEEKTKPTYGLVLHQRDDYTREFRPVAAKVFGADDRTKVRYVHPNLPAAKAGLKVGDYLIAINGHKLEGKSTKEVMELFGSDVRESRRNIGSRKEQSQIQSLGDTLRLTVERDSSLFELSVCGVSAYRCPVMLGEGDHINAFADGEQVVIFGGMVRFAETDEELALVVGHEIAHNLLGHISKRTTNSLLGALADIATAATLGVNTGGAFSEAAGNAFSQDFEFEADYAGLYLAARAGYAIDQAPDFWRRMAVEHPSSIKKNFTASHPSTPERFLALETTVAEITDKRSRNEAMVPNPKSSGGSRDHQSGRSKIGGK